MSAMLLVLVCMGAGAVAARLPHPPQLVTGLNWWVLNIALPALVLVSVTRLDISPALLWPAAGMWLVFGGAWLLLHGLGRAAGWSRGQIGALVLTCGLGNTSFVGFPLIEALRGPGALPLAVVADQLGTFVQLATLGIVVAALYAGSRPRAVEIGRRILSFPAFLALVAALMLTGFGIDLPGMLRAVLARLGDTMTPLALFAVGLQLQLRVVRHDLVPMLAGLGWKLALAPAAVWAMLTLADVRGQAFDIAVLQAAMAPMVTAGILAQQHGLAPRLASGIVGIGIVLSLATVPLWNSLLG